jgi:hypothetical protein
MILKLYNINNHNSLSFLQVRFVTLYFFKTNSADMPIYLAPKNFALSDLEFQTFVVLPHWVVLFFTTLVL